MAQTFLELLNDQHEWPSDYLFKFVVPKAQLEELTKKIDLKEYESKESSTGKYISITFSWKMNCAEDVIKIYQKASEVKGLISL